MIDRLKRVIVALTLMVTGFGMMGVMTTSTAYAADCKSSFLGFPAWYDNLTKDNCDIKSPDATENGVSKFVITIALNIIEIALRLVGYAAVGYIIYGGFKYLTSAGMADRITSGRKIIQNALIGLVISILSIAVVNLIAGNL